MVAYIDAIQNVQQNKAFRSFPDRADPRFQKLALFPNFTPKFKLDFNKQLSIFTIGSCFARNIEEALEPLGVGLPARTFSVPKEEWPARPNGLLNEYTPGTMSQRITAALLNKRLPEGTIVANGERYADLLLFGGADVSYDRAVQRREEIFQVYSLLSECDAVIITLGYVEAWFDRETGSFLNRMPPLKLGNTRPDRFEFKRLNVSETMQLLEQPIGALVADGKKIILTVSPVPIATTFMRMDCVTANEFSKSVLRICAEQLSQNSSSVDYFPSYEIVRSAGLPAYMADNIHVRNEVVREITRYMVKAYGDG